MSASITSNGFFWRGLLGGVGIMADAKGTPDECLWWWHFDGGSFSSWQDPGSPMNQNVSARHWRRWRVAALWFWHPCEGPTLLGVKCDTSLGRCWFSVAVAQQTSSHGYRGPGWEREQGRRICGVGGVGCRGQEGAPRTDQSALPATLPSSDSLQIVYLQLTQSQPPSHPTTNLQRKSVFRHGVCSVAKCSCLWRLQILGQFSLQGTPLFSILSYLLRYKNTTKNKRLDPSYVAAI